MDHIKSRVREFLGRYISGQDIADDEDMFAGGYVNSLFVMQLVMFVDEELGAPVEDDDLDMANFRSVEAIVGFVVRKAGTPTGA
ncbi:acyl carrier protein [Streptomyces sp. NPDC048611]|uniref:acyl carrier protein n=1 Tax=Streptomyces sp. NPDC048611 TaxID=3155635 RepID=UPI003421254B